MSIDWKRWLPHAALGGAAVALGAIAPVTWREAATAAMVALLALAVRSRAAADVAMGFGYAVLAASAVARGGEATRIAVVAIAIVALVAMIVRPGRWPMRLLPAIGVGGALAAALPVVTSWLADAPLSRAEVLTRWPTLVACFGAMLLLFAMERERPAPRWLLAIGLAVSGVLGLSRLVSARSELAAAQAQPDAARFDSAARAARAAGWSRGERDARLGQARALLQAGDAAAALQAMPAMLAVDSPTLFARADALAAKALGEGEMDTFRKGLARYRGEPIELSDEGAARLGLWSSRVDRSDAPTHLARGVKAREGERYLAEAAVFAARHNDAEAAARFASQAAGLAPESVWSLCAAASVQPTAERARACLAKLPTHGPSLRTLAAAGDADAARTLGQFDALPKGGTSFGGLIRLYGISIPAAKVHRGVKVPVELAFEVLGNLAPGERYVPLLHLYGSKDIIVADAAIPPMPDWVAGTLIRVRAEVPFDAPADRYRLELGFSPAEGGSRLQPAGQPGHLDIYELGAVEVVP